jgi:hypothetical protein
VRLEGLERHLLQFFEMAEAEKALADASAHVSLAAGAQLELAEIRMAQRQIAPKIAEAVAERAVGVAQEIRAGGGRGRA